MSGYTERLNKANEQIRFTSIRGKEYAEVNQRILAFWALFPEGRIVTEITRDDGKRCDCECAVYRDATGPAAATGHAFEIRQGNVNSTSYVENCETSAVGRALGMLGIGATTAVASAEEVGWAIEHQDAPPGREAPPQNRFAEVARLKAEAGSLGISEDGIRGWIDATFGKPMSEFDADEIEQTEEYMRSIIRDKRELAGA